MTKIMRGIVHGKTIQLENDTGLEDGRKVGSFCGPRNFLARLQAGDREVPSRLRG
jgi:hypothetical protein